MDLLPPRRGRAEPGPALTETGIFGDDLAFGTTAFDCEDRDPEWKGQMAIPGGEALCGG